MTDTLTENRPAETIARMDLRPSDVVAMEKELIAKKARAIQELLDLRIKGQEEFEIMMVTTAEQLEALGYKKPRTAKQAIGAVQAGQTRSKKATK